MADYTTTITNLAAALGCANDARTVSATLEARWRAKEPTDARPADPAAYASTVEQMRYVAAMITKRENATVSETEISDRAASLIASSAAYLAP